MSDEAARPDGPALPRCPHCGGDHPPHLLKCPDTDMPLPLEGRMLHGKFRFVRQLGKGGMAAVWSAINTLVERTVAIKLIRPEAGRNEETVARFRAEAKAAGRINHPNVSDIIDFGLGPLGPYIVMERLRGMNLGQLIHREERLDPALTVTITRQALLGLEAAHQHGIIHRDLKPENIFLHQPEQGPTIVKIMDFGVSKFIDGSSEVETANGALLGTPEYMSPEQFKGASRSNVRTDIWAMGAILYKALTGQTAFGGPSVAGTLLMVTTEEPTAIDELVRGVPPDLVAIVERCLSKDPELRFQSAQEMSDELEAFDLETLDSLTLVEAGEDLDESAGPTIAVSRGSSVSRDKPGSVPPPGRSHSEQPTMLPTTTNRKTPGLEERRPSRRNRRAGLLIGGVAVVGAGILYMLARGPHGPSTPDDSEGSIATAAAPAAHPTDPVDLGSSLSTEGTSSDSTGVIPPSSTGALHSGSTTGASTGTATGPGSTSGISSTGDTDGSTSDSDGTSGGNDPDPEANRSQTPTRPSFDPSQPPPTPAGTVRAERYLTPKKQGPSGTHAEAKAYCRSLARQSFAGFSNWKMASPIAARKLAKAARRGKYWTAALWQGKAITISLPSKKQDSRAAGKSGLRPLCFVRWP